MSGRLLYVDNDNAIKIDRLRDRTGAYVFDGSVVMTLLDESGEEVPVVGNQAPWPVAAEYEEGSNPPRYVAPVTRFARLSEERTYIARVEASDGPGRYGVVDYECWAVRRRA